MTAWQDQPPLSGKPLSRRQVRESERGDGAAGQVGVAQQTGEQADFTGFAREGWDTEARRLAASAPQPQNDAPPAASRRSQRSLQAVEQQPVAEPLNYSTQARPQTPSTDGQQLRRRSVSAVQDQMAQDQAVQGQAPADHAPADQQQVQQPTGYRVRDFSPEGRRTSFSSTTPEPIEPENLDYRTQGSPAPVAPTRPSDDERTLSRRQIRAMESSAVASAPPALVEPPAPVEQARVRDRNRPLSNEQDYRAAQALAEFEALTGQGGATSAPAQTTPVQPAPVQPAPVQEAVQQQPSVEVNPFDALLNQREEPSTYTPPTGHWSTQAMIDDDEQFQENTLSRNVGATSGAITTSALVIPSLPSEDALRPLGSTGEILITGTIDLPRSLGSTGAHPSRYDHSDVDAFLEASDREDSDPDSAPVRAIRAVSTHTSTRGVMEAKKPKGGSRLPIVLAVAATAMAVGVIVLVVAGIVFGIFK